MITDSVTRIHTMGSHLHVSFTHNGLTYQAIVNVATQLVVSMYRVTGTSNHHDHYQSISLRSQRGQVLVEKFTQLVTP